MGRQWLMVVIALVTLGTVTACNDEAAVNLQPTLVSEDSADGSQAAETGAPGSDDAEAPAEEAGDGADSQPDAPDQGDSELPADPMAGPMPFDVDACAVLVRAVGMDAIAKALGDPVVDSSSLFGNCSMSTAERQFDDGPGTSTGTLAFAVSPTSLAGAAGPDSTAVDGLTDSALDSQSSILWHRAPYWFTLQVLPLQRSMSDPDRLPDEDLIAMAHAIDANA